MDGKEATEIPFGAFDSELKGWEYTIPEGMEARIENGKIIVREKESEDEKIRKELLAHIQQERASATLEVNHAKWDRMIAWLEKQGNKEEINEASYRTGIKRVLDNPESYGLEKQGSQNLANSAKTCKVEPMFKVGDRIKYAGQPDRLAEKIIAIRNDAYYFSEVVSLPFIEQDKWELAGQKPADKVEQNPAWSEEDEKMLNDVIGAIENLISRNESWGYLEDSLEWLKSLKERYTWKPSDEQMRALKGVASYNKNDTLESLYNDLKKLKG